MTLGRKMGLILPNAPRKNGGDRAKGEFFILISLRGSDRPRFNTALRNREETLRSAAALRN